MKVVNMISPQGNRVPNQFIITTTDAEGREVKYFQSYQSFIVRKVYEADGTVQVTLDREKWDFSCTTGKYRNQFLGESKAETERKIKAGQYRLDDLN